MPFSVSSAWRCSRNCGQPLFRGAKALARAEGAHALAKGAQLVLGDQQERVGAAQLLLHEHPPPPRRASARSAWRRPGTRRRRRWPPAAPACGSLAVNWMSSTLVICRCGGVHGPDHPHHGALLVDHVHPRRGHRGPPRERQRGHAQVQRLPVRAPRRGWRPAARAPSPARRSGCSVSPERAAGSTRTEIEVGERKAGRRAAAAAPASPPPAAPRRGCAAPGSARGWGPCTTPGSWSVCPVPISPASACRGFTSCTAMAAA